MVKYKDNYDIGVIVGRFQVPELTESHQRIIREVSGKHNQCIVVVGVSPTLGTNRNPLGYMQRMQMIRSHFPDVIIAHVIDMQSDLDWSASLDKTIKALCPIGSICLYGGRDSFIPHYHGTYDTYELNVIPGNGTDVRVEVGRNIIDTVDFRKGIIHSCQNQFPKVYLTVDIAVIKKENKKCYVLMGKRTIESGLQFIGGFVDSSDETIEQAALRELSEEVDIETNGELRYICSKEIDDWRYRNSNGKIITAFYSVKYTFGTGEAKEEFVDTEWIQVQKTNLDYIADSHKPLFMELIKRR